MKRIALLLFLVASPALGQGALTHLRIFDAGSIPATCDPEGRLYVVTGAASATACDGTTGTSTALCACDSAGTGYVAVSGSGGGHSDGANCAAGEIPLGVDANGAVQGCYEPAEADISDLAHTTDTNLTQEEVEDFAGAMVTGNTETRITVTYQDADGTVDFVVDDMNDDQPDSDAEVPDAITVDGGAILNSTVTLDTGTNPTTDGQLRWDSTTERLEIGDDGAATLELYPGAHTTAPGPSPDCSGTSTYQDGEGGCDAVGGDISGGLDAVVVSDNSHNHIESNVTDLAHVTDTNANTICTGTTTYLDGEGNCDTIAGGGDVSGPASSTDNEIPRYDGVGGKTLQNSLLAVADTTGLLFKIGDDAGEGLLFDNADGGADNPLTITDAACADGPCLRVVDDDLYFYASGGVNYWYSRTSPSRFVIAQPLQLSNGTAIDWASDSGTEIHHLGADSIEITVGSLQAIEFTEAASVVTVTIDDALELDPQSAPPVTCAAGTEGTLYADSSSNELCFCDGTSYVGLVAGGACT